LVALASNPSSALAAFDTPRIFALQRTDEAAIGDAAAPHCSFASLNVLFERDRIVSNEEGSATAK